MTLKNFLGGLSILEKYFDDTDGYVIGAEHDQFYLYSTDRDVSPEDKTSLDALGWFQPEDGEGGWSAFT